MDNGGRDPVHLKRNWEIRISKRLWIQFDKQAKGM
jgi:hypothetical protein